MANPLAMSFYPVIPDGRKQRTVTYLFKNKGDEIPLHSHEFWHSCCCFEGTAEIFDDTGKTAQLDAGKFVELNAKRKHGIRALENNTRTVHVNEPGN